MNTNDFLFSQAVSNNGWLGGVTTHTDPGIPMLILLDVILTCFIATWLIVRRNYPWPCFNGCHTRHGDHGSYGGICLVKPGLKADLPIKHVNSK